MKSLRIIGLSLIMFLSFITASAKQSDYIIIVNGLFYKELPADIKNNSTPQDMNMFIIHTPNETKAVCLYAPSIVLAEESKQYVIPVEKVTEGEELLRRYNEQKEESKGIGFTMGAKKPLIKVGDKFPDFSATDITGSDGQMLILKGK